HLFQVHSSLVMKKSAFTLIELLVVIAIIAVLAGIALPVFMSAQEKARAIKDANGLHQLGVAIAAYLNDSSDSIFQTTTPSTPWPKQLNPKYVQGWKIFQSPFDKRDASENVTTAPVSYDVNTNILTKSMSDVASPSSCV